MRSRMRSISHYHLKHTWSNASHHQLHHAPTSHNFTKLETPMCGLSLGIGMIIRKHVCTLLKHRNIKDAWWYMCSLLEHSNDHKKTHKPLISTPLHQQRCLPLILFLAAIGHRSKFETIDTASAVKIGKIRRVIGWYPSSHPDSHFQRNEMCHWIDIQTPMDIANGNRGLAKKEKNLDIPDTRNRRTCHFGMLSFMTIVQCHGSGWFPAWMLIHHCHCHHYHLSLSSLSS